MLTTLIGTLFGGLFRLAPEIFKFFERKDERKHELTMFAQQLEADKARSQLRIDEVHAEYEGRQITGEIALMDKAVTMQGQLTGNKFADACNTLMRPLITFWWCIVMYSLALVAHFYVLLQQAVPPAQAFLTIWGADEKAIVASIISFWFVDRSIRKAVEK